MGVCVSGAPEFSTARLRAGLFAAIRRFFDGRGFVEVDTPAIVDRPLPERHVATMRVVAPPPNDPGSAADGSLGDGADGSTGGVGGGKGATRGTPDLGAAGGARRERSAVDGRVLSPSPEVYLKRLIAAGYGSVYQLSHVFRGGERGPIHLDEFAMLEWYHVPGGYETAAATTRELFAELVGGRGPFAGAFSPHALNISVADAWRRWVGGELVPPESADEGWEDEFHRQLVAEVEPRLPTDRPAFLWDYPATVPALARRARNPRFRRRWEVYVGGMEIANCYDEMIDLADLEHYGALLGVDSDEGWNAEARLHAAMPPCSGVALGVDRLLAALLGRRSLDGVAFFPPRGILEENHEHSR